MKRRFVALGSVPTRAAAAVAALLAAGAWSAAPGDAATPQEVIAALNAQRAAHGIPAGLVEDPRLSRACALHNRYLALNPGSYPHEEVAGRPGYTRTGAAIASRSLLTTGSFDSGSNPFDDAPFHLAELMRPRLYVTGASESDGWTCIVVRGARERRASRLARLYTYPGPASARVQSRQVVWNEFPYAPGDLMGVPQGTTSGPHLFMFALARNEAPLRVRDASLRGPAGRIPLRVLEDSDPGALMRPPSAIFLAREPLATGAYCGTVRASLAGYGRFTHRWAFATEGSNASAQAACPPPPEARLRLIELRRLGSSLRVVVAVHPGSRGRLTVSVGARSVSWRLRRAGLPERRGGSRVHAFRGALPRGARARRLALTVHYRRTDGAPDAEAALRLRRRG